MLAPSITETKCWRRDDCTNLDGCEIEWISIQELRCKPAMCPKGCSFFERRAAHPEPLPSFGAPAWPGKTLERREL